MRWRRWRPARTCWTSTPASRSPTSRRSSRRRSQLVQSITDVPLSIDSSIVAALAAGLAVYKGKALVNSVTGEEERLEVGAAAGQEIRRGGGRASPTTRPASREDPDVRFAVAKKIVERAADYGIPRSDIVIDPLVMPIGAIGHRRRAGDAARAPAAHRAQGQHDLRRVQRQLRPAAPRRHQHRRS